MKFATDGKDGAVRALGASFALALSATALEGLSAGLCLAAVLFVTEFITALFRPILPDKLRFSASLLLAATTATLLSILAEKFFPAFYGAAALYFPALAFETVVRIGTENTDAAFFTGLFTVGALFLAGIIRELLGSGSLFGFGLWDFQIGFFKHPAGAFFVLGVIAACMNLIKRRTHA